MRTSDRWMIGITAVLIWIFLPFLGNAFTIKQPLGVVLAGGWLFLAAWKGHLPGRISPVVYPAFALAAAAAGSAFRAQNPGVAFHELALLFSGLLLFMGAAQGCFSKGFHRVLGKALVILAVPPALLAIAQWFWPDPLNFGLQALGKMKVFSTLGNPNFLAAFLVFVLPLSVVNIRNKSGDAPRLLRGAIALILFAALAATESKSGYLALVFIMALAVMQGVRKTWARWCAGAVLGLVGAGAVYSGLATHTGRGRWLVWRESLEIFRSHPWFGVGPGNFNLHQAQAQWKVFGSGDWAEKYMQNAAFLLDAHCEPLNVMVECGGIGLVFWLALAGVALKRGWGKIEKHPWRRGWFFGWCGLLFFCLWNAPLFLAPLALLFWLGAGFLAAPPEEKASPPGRMLRGGAMALGLALTALGVWWTFGIVQSGRAEFRGNQLLETGPFDEAVGCFDSAIRYLPHDGYLHEKRALALFFDNRFPEALEALDAAGHLYGDVGIPYLKAEILAREKRYDEAVPIYEFIARAFPNHFTPPFMLGQIYDKLGKKQDARRCFERVLAIPKSSHNLKSDHGNPDVQKDFARDWLDRNP